MNIYSIFEEGKDNKDKRVVRVSTEEITTTVFEFDENAESPNDFHKKITITENKDTVELADGTILPKDR